MLAEIRSKAQITLPKAIVASLGLEEGDKLDIQEKDGVIYMMPVTVYPKGYIDALRSELTQLKEDIQVGKKPVFSSIDALMEKLEDPSC
ncbi:MAG: AbrB/MazE/SpoVT family DNA-binding domain-containing protein [Clostridia bacterium]|nr:AbrB/MazE/SpoVT family DNA-binding domain-containing protein [Clostridia bacterium]